MLHLECNNTKDNNSARQWCNEFSSQQILWGITDKVHKSPLISIHCHLKNKTKDMQSPNITMWKEFFLQWLYSSESMSWYKYHTIDSNSWLSGGCFFKLCGSKSHINCIFFYFPEQEEEAKSRSASWINCNSFPKLHWTRRGSRSRPESWINCSCSLFVVNWHLLSNLYTAPNMKFGEAPKTEKSTLFCFHSINLYSH